MNTSLSIKRDFERIEADQSTLIQKEQDLKVLSEEVAKLKSTIRNAKSTLAFHVSKHPDGKITFNCGHYALILKSERCEKLIDEPQHKSYLLIVDKEPFA